MAGNKRLYVSVASLRAGDDTKQCANGMGFALSADNCSENSATGCGDRIDNLAGFYIN